MSTVYRLLSSDQAFLFLKKRFILQKKNIIYNYGKKEYSILFFFIFDAFPILKSFVQLCINVNHYTNTQFKIISYFFAPILVFCWLNLSLAVGYIVLVTRNLQWIL